LRTFVLQKEVKTIATHFIQRWPALVAYDKKAAGLVTVWLYLRQITDI